MAGFDSAQPAILCSLSGVEGRSLSGVEGNLTKAAPHIPSLPSAPTPSDLAPV